MRPIEALLSMQSRASLLIPAADITATPMESPDSTSANSLPSSPQRLQRVLVMDDEISIRNVCEELLQLLKYEVETAADGTEALALFHQAEQRGTPFDLLITDLTVPGGMGGVETMRRLRESGSQVLAIASSGYSNGPVMSNPAQYGFNGILPKPYRLHDLEAVLQRVTL